jgi:Tfp pilus assembly protein PilX
MMSPKRQRGAVLLVSLVILMIITLFVISSANISSSDLRTVGNFQSKLVINQNAQQAIEQVLSSVSSFTTPLARSINVNGLVVAVSAPSCRGFTIASGYTAVNNITLYDTNWAVTATSTDPITGATATITQGVRIRLPDSTCPN